MLEDRQFGILMLDNILYGIKILFWTVSSTCTLTHNGNWYLESGYDHLTLKKQFQ